MVLCLVIVPTALPSVLLWGRALCVPFLSSASPQWRGLSPWAALVRSLGLLQEEHVFSSMAHYSKGSAACLWLKIESQQYGICVEPDHGQ